MITFKCKMCGGDLHPEENATTCECEYCGSVQTIPTADNEKKGNLFNRANRLRMAAEYDKAAAVYTSITAEFPEEAEAYWGLCLCKYGIEYVEDPVTAKKIPTCHRTRSESIMDDPDFDQACENADAVAKRVYREEAKAIDRLQQDILSVVANESPYDVFICYKETDNSGQRTEDSVLAQDIYDSLTAKGLKVFFARITLEDKLGQQYEPYIYAALHSAKVMLAIGTQFEYFDAVWVKNEWSRFLDMMKSDKSKTLIPCYKDIDAYDMPREFKNLQGQDMGKLGWLQDLTRGVVKLIGPKEEKKIGLDMGQSVSTANPTIVSLMTRAQLYLEQKDQDHAIEYYNRVLDSDPQNADAYIGLLLAENSFTKPNQIPALAFDFSTDKHFINALRFSSETTKARLEEFLRIKKKNNLIAAPLFWYYDCAKMSSLWQESAIDEFEFIAAIFLAMEEEDNAATSYSKVLEKMPIVNPDEYYVDGKLSEDVDRIMCRGGKWANVKFLPAALGYFAIEDEISIDFGITEPILLGECIPRSPFNLLGDEISIPPNVKDLCLSHYSDAYKGINPNDVLMWGEKIERIAKVPELFCLVSIVYYVFGVNTGEAGYLEKVYTCAEKAMELSDSSIVLEKCQRIFTSISGYKKAKEYASQCNKKQETVEKNKKISKIMSAFNSADTEAELDSMLSQIQEIDFDDNAEITLYKNQIDDKRKKIKEEEEKELIRRNALKHIAELEDEIKSMRQELSNLEYLAKHPASEREYMRVSEQIEQLVAKKGRLKWYQKADKKSIDQQIAELEVALNSERETCQKEKSKHKTALEEKSKLYQPKIKSLETSLKQFQKTLMDINV